MQLGKRICVGWAVALGLAGHGAQAKWALTQRPADERARACQEQVSFCYNSCGSVMGTTTNFCNIRTMGWDCRCASPAAEARVRSHEWPVAIAECRAALGMCTDGCLARENGAGRSACFASCTADYPCNTAAAPASSLRVMAPADKPPGYIPPVDDRDIELPIGMKLGSGSLGQGASDPGALPRVVPRDSDTRATAAAGGNSRGGRHAPGRHGASGKQTSAAPAMRPAAVAAAVAALVAAAALGY
ncbi:hypothetical protein H4R18_000036 [Coemansia javaensis]|uniref:DUF7707 domain-containing protein n=1 Tax=Coemansia javaensis TaxID=2761396 RepID=A0A9W8HJ85_9FUNG|nr:hypothetical protein H4R18_000036 [Coemansia javaensis]